MSVILTWSLWRYERQMANFAKRVRILMHLWNPYKSITEGRIWRGPSADCADLTGRYRTAEDRAINVDNCKKYALLSVDVKYWTRFSELIAEKKKVIINLRTRWVYVLVCANEKREWVDRSRRIMNKCMGDVMVTTQSVIWLLLRLPHASASQNSKPLSWTDSQFFDGTTNAHVTENDAWLQSAGDPRSKI